jgi:hypothetical protein
MFHACTEAYFGHGISLSIVKQKVISLIVRLYIEPDSHLRFQVLSKTSMRMAVFLVVAPCSLVEVYQRL